MKVINVYNCYYQYILGLTIAPSGFDTFTCHATLVCVTCDLPAKAIVMNFTQFNGFYGCCHCYQKGN